MVDIGLEFEVGETEDDLEFDAQDYVGLSAYQIAVKHGYEGTEEQWIASISKTKTSQLENDGNGKSPFATEAYVDEHSSAGGTTDYNQLINKPKINGVELSGEVELAVPHSTSELNNDGNGSGSPFATEKYVQEHQSGGSKISKTSQLVNDGDGNSPFATKTEVEEAIAAVPAPKVPTKTSELENDGDGTSSFATQQDVADAAKDKLTIVTNTTTATKAYIAKTDGSQGTIDIATGVAANTLAQRGADGRLQVGTATADNDAVNLSYANAHYVAAEEVQNKLDKNKGGWSVYEPYRKAYIVTRGGGQDTLYISEYSRPNGYNSNWIVGYSSEGNLLCTSINWEREPGQSSNFATNKGYVDDADNKIKDIVSKQAADIDLLYTLIENTIITLTEVEDTYTTRVTAGGLPVVSNTPTTVHRICGDTVATEDGLKHASFKGVTSTGADGETDTSFQLSAARQLRKWDYIDIDNQRVATGTAEVTQDTEFTDDELATYPAEYILSADRKTIAYPLETPTTAPLTVPQTYTVWRNGMETVDTGEVDALPPTITQTYYEEVASNQ